MIKLRLGIKDFDSEDKLYLDIETNKELVELFKDFHYLPDHGPWDLMYKSNDGLTIIVNENDLMGGGKMRYTIELTEYLRK